MRKLILAMAVAAPGVGVICACLIGLSHLSDESLLYRFQTLIAGAVAIGAAFVGGGFILHQVKAAEVLDDRRRAREFRGAKAGLSSILSSITEYNKACERELERVHVLVGAGTVISGIACDFPDPPTELVPALRELVQLGSEREASAIEELLSHLQIVRARLQSLKEGASGSSRLLVTKFELAARIIDLGQLRAMSDRLFDFARRRGSCPSPHPTNGEIQAAILQSEAGFQLMDAAERIFSRR